MSDGLRQRRPGEGEPIRTRPAGAVDELPQHLLEDEGVPLGSLEHELVELRIEAVLAEDRGEHLPNALRRQGLELDQLRQA